MNVTSFNFWLLKKLKSLNVEILDFGIVDIT